MLLVDSEHVVHCISKNNAIKKDLHHGEKWLSFGPDYAIDVHLAIVLDVPISENASGVGQNMLSQKAQKYELILILNGSKVLLKLKAVTFSLAHVEDGADREDLHFE